MRGIIFKSSFEVATIQISLNLCYDEKEEKSFSGTSE